ncbi:PAS domain S-box protein [Pseudomonas putida]|uniref:PAS domain S-box protein n=1 Tax=Pseudomonas putida TaxID=303 RepID=UPI0018E6CC56|nr:PAS domain S-box protein [Pseudomonas putida]MBI6939928.1 PAS domain S-box protein [Pseudomonas putida]MBI6956102.1 PAS domain S-box protein [Pseudomonas putida]
MSDDSFAFRLKELLELRKLTLQSVADTLGVSRTAVHKWTRGGEIDFELLRKLATLLGVNWIWLRYGEQAQQEAQGHAPQSLPMTDVRRKHTAQIMESEARMKLAQENARIVTWEWNLLTDEVTYSSNVESVYGWPVKHNEDFWSHIPPQDVTPLQAVFDESIRTGQPCDTDFRMQTRTGEIRWISSRATPLLDDQGRALKMIGISMDTTARKIAEQTLRESEERLRAVFELANDAMAFVDLEGRWLMVNDAFTRLTGQGIEQLASTPLHTLFDDGPQLLSAILQAPQGIVEHRVTLPRPEAPPLAAVLKAKLYREQGAGKPSQLVLVLTAL